MERKRKSTMEIVRVGLVALLTVLALVVGFGLLFQAGDGCGERSDNRRYFRAIRPRFGGYGSQI